VGSEAVLKRLVEEVKRAALAVFVDAREGAAAGSTCEEVVDPGGRAPLSHHLSPGHLLALALHGRAPRGAALSVSGADFAHGGEPSREVKDALRSSASGSGGSRGA
jgi:hypothetical protein